MDAATVSSDAAAPARPPLLRIRDLQTHIDVRQGTVRAVDGVNLDIAEREALGVVGESGSGKTMTGLSILKLLPRPGGRIAGGRIELDGTDLVGVPEREMARNWRGRRVSMVSQDPLTSLNPVYSIGDQVGGPFRYHGLAGSRAEARSAAIEVLGRVRIPSPEKRLDDYPHQFSGGMRQRVVAAMAIACQPRLLIADEPTSALDVTIQVQMIDLLKRIQQDTGVGILMITHDMGVAASMCDRIAVMYAGRVVESGPVRRIYHAPAHPYTQALLASIPRLGQTRARLEAIGGQPPSLLNPPRGCRFAARCPQRMARCEEAYPPEFATASGHRVACWLHEGAPHAA
ncbi:MAG: ABC transporter ATP-binding protein [Pseudorhodoferax sp.]